MSTAPTIRVASYNLRGFRDDLAAAAAVVRAIDPDVLLVQEAPRHPLAGYRISQFARDCDLFWSGRSHRLAGTTILTSLRVVATDALDRPIPVPRFQNPRAFTTTHVHVPGAGAVTAVSLHLPLEADQRLAHAQHVLAQLRDDPATRTDALVVGGDLNEVVTGAAWQLLGQQLAQVSGDAPTFPTRRGPDTGRCIDAIFATPGLVPADGGGGGRRELSELPEGAVAAASDHAPVWVDLVVPPA